MTLACSYALSAVLQPGIASLLRHMWIRQEKGLCGLYFLVAVLSLLLLFLPQSSAAWEWGWGSCWRLPFPLLLPAAPGQLPGPAVEPVRISHRIQFLPGGASLFFPVSPPLQDGFFKEFPCRSHRFPVLLLGIGCLSLAHTLVDNFMLKIMQSFGGGSQNQGVALFHRLSGRGSRPMAIWAHPPPLQRRTLLIFAAWAWMLKTFLIFLARSPVAIYAAETLQFCSYAFYTPASVHCADQWFSPEHRLQGQSLIGSAYTADACLPPFWADSCWTPWASPTRCWPSWNHDPGSRPGLRQRPQPAILSVPSPPWAEKSS